MSHHDTHATQATSNVESNADSLFDAKSAVALILIVVLTVCFWLVGR